MLDRVTDRLLLRYSLTPLHSPRVRARPSSDQNHFSDTPTPKFGEALRQQVEERLAFFETGAAPGKNADAIRKVLDQLSLEKEDEEMADATEPVLPLIEAEPTTKKKDKKKKRKLEEMEVDGDDESEGEPVKKVKLSKEEKKALKKEKKRERKEKEAAEVSCSPLSPSPQT